MRRFLLFGRIHQRLIASAAVTVALYLLLPWPTEAADRYLVAWDLGIVLYLGLAASMIVHSGVPQMRERASIEDDGAIAVLLLTLGTTLASLVAIFAELNGVKGAAVVEQTARLSLAGFTIICSWFFVNTIFAIHYGHDYYGARGGREGLQFPGGGDPDYWDFLYFSFTIGAAVQTSDVAITTPRMRRLVLGHTVVSFLFNTTILAIAVNVGASLF